MPKKKKRIKTFKGIPIGKTFDMTVTMADRQRNDKAVLWFDDNGRIRINPENISKK